MENKGKLYLLPVPLSEDWSEQMPTSVANCAKKLRYFIVERTKTARRFIKLMQHPLAIDDMVFFELNKHTKPEELDGFLQPLAEGKDIGLMTEAGCPAVADPGAIIVRKAHEIGAKVVPLVGPSSLLLALMASGMDGQQFVFNGYLPQKQHERIEALKRLETQSKRQSQTQIMIETPYRNTAFFQDAVKHLSPMTLFCVAMDLTLEAEYVKTQKIMDWRRTPAPDLDKRPCVFLVFVP
jgi:16S rRNA (cytidine1402-2'-O)-methyltransferase